LSDNIRELKISGAYEFTADPKYDDRGFFVRVFCQNQLISVNNARNILQMNISYTKYRGTIRGMHYQRAPYQEDKFVRCIRGSVFDVIVDLRRESETFGRWESIKLTAHKMNAVYIPKGCAHGFQTLEDDCEILYCHSEIHAPAYEAGFKYDCDTVGIEWPIEPRNISRRDNALPKFGAAS